MAKEEEKRKEQEREAKKAEQQKKAEERAKGSTRGRKRSESSTSRSQPKQQKTNLDYSTMRYHSMSVQYALDFMRKILMILGIQLQSGFSVQTRIVQYGATLTAWRRLMENVSVQ